MPRKEPVLRRKQHEAESEQGYNWQFPFASPPVISVTLEQKFAKADAKPPTVHHPIKLPKQNNKKRKSILITIDLSRLKIPQNSKTLG